MDLFSTPGILGESLRIYLARDLEDADAPDGFLREGEEAHMDTVWAPLSDLVDAVLAGRVHSPSLVAGVLSAWIAWQRDQFASLREAYMPWPARESAVAAMQTDPPAAD